MNKLKSAVKIRREQILKQLDHLRTQLTTKTRKHFKTDQRFEQTQKRWHELIFIMEQELSMLDYPEEYNELPVAVVAEELGFTIEMVKSLIAGGEIEASGKSPHERISRDELGRIAELGVKELLRLEEEEPPTIFNRAIEHLQNGDIELAERQYRRLEAREDCIGTHALALELALYLYKGEYSEIQQSLNFINSGDHLRRADVLAYLKHILSKLSFNDESKQARAENLLAVCENTDCYADDPEHYAYTGKKYFKHMDELQQRAMYINTVVKNEIEKSKFHHSLISDSRLRFPIKLEPIIRNAIYTALYAEATYNELASSKMYVDAIRAQMPRWWELAKLLQKLPRRKATTKP